MPDFENEDRRANSRLRQDARAGGPAAPVVGYEDGEGQPRPLIGDQDAPYVSPLGRASLDPTAADPGVPAVGQSDNQRLLTDEYGRLVVIEAPAPPSPTSLPLTSNLIPQANDAGVLVVATVPAALYEAWVGDFQSALVRYLLVFDDNLAPAPNDIPAIAAIPIDGGWMNYDFTTEAGPETFTTGIVLALSSTPNKYTAIAPASDFAITARFKVI